MIRPTLLALLLATPALQAVAQSSSEDISTSARVDAARAEIEEFAQVLDADGDGLIARDELMTVAEEAFPSLDADASEDVDQVEFRDWQFGLSEMAEFRGREQAYDAAMGLVFDLFDFGDDGLLDRPEFLEGIDASLSYADRDGDGALTHDEYLRGFITNVALRHALVE